MGNSVSEAKLVEYGNDAQFGRSTPGKIGMWIFLGTDGMSFFRSSNCLWNS